MSEQTTPTTPAPRVEFTDEWGVKHSLTIEQAAEELRKWENAWPGGLEEVEACIAQLNRSADWQRP